MLGENLTNQGTLLAYIKQAWTETSPIGTADIHWSEEWYDTAKAEYPQLTVSPLTEPKLQRFRSGADMKLLMRPLWNVNVWYRVPTGSDGTLQLDAVERMRKEACRVFLAGFNANLGTANYGGSLSPFGVVLPQDKGRSLNEDKYEPRILRFEVTLVATEHFAK